MRVLFINPSRAGRGNIPVNIPLLISVLKKHGHNVRLFDFTDYAEFDHEDEYDDMFFKSAPIDQSKILNDRKNFYKNNFGTVTGSSLKKSDYNKDFEKILIEFRPDIIAVSSLSIDFSFISKFLLPFKKQYEIPVIFGGIHAILLPEEVLNSEACDFVCIGEGENCLPNLLDAIEKKKSLTTVNGIWFKENGKIIKPPPISLTDLSSLPFLDFTCFDPIHFYRPFDGKRYKMVNYEFSRGCPYQCSYCVNGTLQEKYKGLGKYNRIKNIDQSIEELKFLINKYKFDFIRFWDENFASIKTSYLEEYSARYIKEINLPFLIYARVESVTKEKVKILKNMGCKTFAMGIESGNEFIRKTVMNRKMSNEEIIEKFNLVKSFGIRVSAYNMIGLPYEIREHIFDTIELNRKVKADSFSVTILEPYKGTPIRKMCEDQGLDPNHETISGPPQFIPRGMTYEELNGLFRTFPFYIRFPKEKYDEIKLAETNDEIYKQLRKEFSKMYLV